eukprot:evm.model.scf_229.12 EVM.evm.TU.scf_229.12   scf_229:109417-110322(-)
MPEGGLGDIGVDVRQARAGEIPALLDLEMRAGELFRTVGMDSVADGPGLSADDLVPLQREGTLWVAVAPDGCPAGFLAARPAAGALYIKELSVDPAFQRRGVASKMLEALSRDALEAGVGTLALTTFREVPWNAPFYARRGFVESPIPEELIESVAGEEGTQARALVFVPSQAVASI